VLIEPSQKLADLSEQDRTDSVWDLVSKANEVLPGHAKVDQAHTKILEDRETFLRSTKGTVQRRPTTHKLEYEIEKVSQDAESSLVVHNLNFESWDSLRTSLVRALHEAGLRNAEQLRYDESLFAYGLDSLQTLRLSKALQSSLDNGTSSSALKTMIYNNTTIDEIAQTLTKLRNGEAISEEDPDTTITEMERILEDCQASIETVDSVYARPSASPQAMHVLLRGSTGGLDSYVLDKLLANPSTTVTCLNRAGSSVERQKRINAEKSLNVDFSRVLWTA
jgi:aryl carrier-like protein